MFLSVGLDETVYGNQQCPETIEEFQQRVEVAAATVRGTSGVFFLSIRANMFRRADVYIASQRQYFEHLL